MKICSRCKKVELPDNHPFNTCDTCREYNKSRALNEQRRRRNAGLCICCGKVEPQEGLARCLQCATKHNKSSGKRYAISKENGMCTRCHKHMATISSMCEICWYKDMASAHINNVNDWQKLKDMLISQQFTCAYTNLKIVPGINASVDHKFPPSRGGTFTIENVHWVDLRVNKMKSNLTHEEFIELVNLIK